MDGVANKKKRLALEDVSNECFALKGIGGKKICSNTHGKTSAELTARQGKQQATASNVKVKKGKKLKKPTTKRRKSCNVDNLLNPIERLTVNLGSKTDMDCIASSTTTSTTTSTTIASTSALKTSSTSTIATTTIKPPTTLKTSSSSSSFSSSSSAATAAKMTSSTTATTASTTTAQTRIRPQIAPPPPPPSSFTMTNDLVCNELPLTEPVENFDDDDDDDDDNEKEREEKEEEMHHQQQQQQQQIEQRQQQQIVVVDDGCKQLHHNDQQQLQQLHHSELDQQQVECQQQQQQKDQQHQQQQTWIDVDVGSNVYYLPEYVNDIFDYYRSREKKFTIPDYMSTTQPDLSASMRSILIDWLVEVQQNFELIHETLYTAVKLIDIYSSRVPVKKSKLQLIGAVSLNLACKFEERCPPMLDDFVYVCDDAYPRSEFLKMEEVIFQTVGFDIGLPLSYTFLRRYATCGRANNRTLTLSRFILETSLMHYQFVTCLDSVIASACLFIAMAMNDNGSWDDTMYRYTKYRPRDFEDVVYRLNDMICNPPEPTLTTILSKYSHPVFLEVANIQRLSNEQLKNLIHSC